MTSLEEYLADPESESWTPIQHAAAAMHDYIANAWEIRAGDVPQPCDRQHLFWMIGKILDGEVTGEAAHRWLGWIQYGACLSGTIGLDQLRDLNRDIFREED